MQRRACHAGPAPARRRGAEPRPARRHGRALRRGERPGADRRPSAPRRRGRLARAPLDARRLAAAAADAARAALRHRRAGPLEDERQPAPRAGGAGLVRAAGAGSSSPMRCRLHWALAAVAAALRRSARCSARWRAWCRRGARIELRHFFDVGVDRTAARHGRRGLAVRAARGAGAAAARRHAARAAGAWRSAAAHLLEWTTAAQAQAQARYALPRLPARTAPSPALSASRSPWPRCWSPHPWLGPLLFVLWALAPVAAWWGSRPRRPSAERRARRRATATTSKRWRATPGASSSTASAPEDNHLPPDNLQLEPEPTIAHRTSPTNIGMYLLAGCCAREFGWIDTGGARRPARRHARHRRPPATSTTAISTTGTTRARCSMLPPAYVSSVDSGNLAGHLLAVAQACRALARADGDGSRAGGAGSASRSAARRCAPAWTSAALYDAKRHLFHIGLRVEENVLDASYYDLLASESRLLSFLAIAKGDVPRRHWMALGRPFLSVGVQPGPQVLVGLDVRVPDALAGDGRARSAACCRWRTWPRSREQQAFGSAQHLPWGVSESAYFAQDHSLAYQYSPFGVPRLALRRTPPTDRVVAPYASADGRACSRRREAVANLRLLESLGARGEFGFFDAVDFTVSRQPEGQPFTRGAQLHGAPPGHVAGGAVQRAVRRRAAPLVRQRAAGAGARIAAARAHAAPDHRQRRPAHAARAGDRRSRRRSSSRAWSTRWQPGLQPTHLLSNGRYTVALRANGAGVSRWRSFNVSRWRDDPLRDGYGTFFYVRDDGSRDAHLAHRPARARRATGATARASWPTRCSSTRAGAGLQARITVLISPEDDTELRTVALHNTGSETRTLRADLVLRTGAVQPARPTRRIRPSPTCSSKRRWEPALARAAAGAQAAPARRPGGGGGALRGLGRCAGAVASTA